MNSNLTSEKLYERACLKTPGGVHSPVRSFKGLGRSPVFFKEASGPFLTSVEGKKYIDFCQSFGPLVLGHRDPEVQEGVMDMVRTAWSFGACEPYSLELAEWICERITWIEQLRFVSSGTEAVMSALRVARAATGRTKILKFEACYHGHVDSLLVKAGSGLAGSSASSSLGVSHAVSAETLVIPLDDDAAVEEVFRTQGKEIAAVILEPLPANYGLLIQRKEFLHKLFATAKRNGSLIIFDEVISGFRVALGGMAEKLNYEPDLVTYGKVMGGGFPAACYGGKKELMSLVAPLGGVYQAGTLSANPIGMRAGLLTLQKMERVDGWSQLEKQGAYFESLVHQGFADVGLNFVRAGSLFWIHQKTNSQLRKVEDIPPTQSAAFNKFFLRSLEKGVYLSPNAYEVGFLSLAHTNEVLQEAANILIGSLYEN